MQARFCLSPQCHVWQRARMFDRPIDCLAAPSSGALPVYALRPGELAAFLAGSPHAAFLSAGRFAADTGELRLLPGGDGLSGAVLGLGDSQDPHVFGALPFGLPPGDWRIEPGSFPPEDAVLGFCLGAYQFTEFKPPRPVARLVARPRPGVGYRPGGVADAGPDQHAGRPARPGGTGGGGAGGSGPPAAPRAAASPARRWSATTRRSRPWAPGPTGRRSWRPCAGGAAAPRRMRRCCRCAARACASTAAVTT
ncbi:MAG: hypothetical protein WDN49_22195 [Acetobacteraceae bacterium]